MSLTGARVLVVDDDATNRLKMSLAVKNLGHSVEIASNGALALEMLHGKAFDIVLLDIVMPEMDGFQVLAAMKGDPALRDIPVIVISSLDDELDSVVRAIELGAEDFLPKSFEPVILKARVGACLEKKRLRDLEVAYLKQVSRLTDAAVVLERGSFNPQRLGLDEVTRRDDALGRLARVFVGMAQQVYERERALQQRVRTLKGGLVLLAVGAVFGLIAPLSRIVAGLDAHPLGLTLWVNAIAAVLCLVVAVARRRMPRLDGPLLRYLVVWGLLAGVMQEVLLFWVAGHLEASIISIILVTEGFLVFAFAAAMRLEEPSAKRFIGLGFGLLGVLLIIFAGESITGVSSWIWILAALAVPFLYALEDILIAAKRPEGVDVIAAMGVMMAIATLFMLPIVIVFDDFLPLNIQIGQLEIVVVLIALAMVVATALLVFLVSTTGAVFASQNAYVVTFAGIAWSMLLLGEELSVWAWLALGLMIVGLVLVEPKREAEDLTPVVVPADTAGPGPV